MTATFWGQWRSRKGAWQALGSGLPMTLFPGLGTPIPTILSLDPRSNTRTKRSRNDYANTHRQGTRGPGGDTWSVRALQRAAAEPEPQRGPHSAGPERSFAKPQRWVSWGKQMYSVSARDLGTSQTLTHSREAHLTSFSHHLGQSMSLICRE